MLKRYMSGLFLFFAISFFAAEGFCFDPLTVAIGAQAGQSILNKVDDASDIGFAVSDLMSEVGYESDAEEEGLQRAVDQVYKINSAAKDLKWTSEDLNRSLYEDLSRGKSLTRRIKALRNSIRASKRIAAIMGIRPKAAEKAVHIQQIKLDSMMLEELQSIRRAQYLAYLEDRQAELKREVFIQEILERERPARAAAGRSGSRSRGDL